MYNWIARRMFAQALDYVRGTRTIKCLKELEETQWWAKDNILNLQNIRLRELIKHAYDNVDYYRHIFKERGLKPSDIETGADLNKLPILNKKVIRSNKFLLQAANIPRKKFITSSTSGSTGEPLTFYSIKDDQYNWGYARAQRARSWSGYQLGDRVAIFRPCIPNLSSLQRLSDRSKRTLARRMQVNPQFISEENLPLIVKKLEMFKPEYLLGYPSAVTLIARHVKRSSVLKFNIKAVLTGGEQIYDNQRELFRDAFNCESYSYYSSWEAHDIAGECSQHIGHHIAAENIIIEIVDELGNHVPAGTEGRILITNLHNYAMPFIRYDIGDTGAISDTACLCGREGLPLLVRLNGRADDIIYTKDGKQIPGRSLPQRFLADMGVEQYQIVQESYDEVILKIVINGDIEGTEKGVVQQIKYYYEPILGKEIALKVQLVNQICPNKSGKRAVFVSKVSPLSLV